jgi:hypothetical protein
MGHGTNGRQLYFIKCNDWIKVGRADNPSKRLKELQVGNPYILELRMVLDNAGRYEFLFHRELSNIEHNGEWFKITNESRIIIKKTMGKVAQRMHIKVEDLILLV